MTEHLLDMQGTGESNCCGAKMYNDICADCKEHCEEAVCDMCDGTGFITTMETVWHGEPHQAPIGTEKCECQME